MSDTPRTDAAILAYENESLEGKAWDDLANSMKKLERELAVWKRKRLRSLSGLDDVTDHDLPPRNRTWANLWMARYLESRREIANANRGIARLLRRLDAAKAQRDYVAAENDSLLAENRRLAKIISELEAIRELD